MRGAATARSDSVRWPWMAQLAWTSSGLQAMRESWSSSSMCLGPREEGDQRGQEDAGYQ
jgi:hypothetical protein